MFQTLVNDLPPRISLIAKDFYSNFKKATGKSDEELAPWFITFAKLLAEQIRSPHQFEPYHKAIRAPFDYWEFGLQLARPLFAPGSSLIGHDVLNMMEKALDNNDNVILLANHQTELDPQITGAMLEKDHPKLIDKLIFVAGSRVITDPIAIPFSMGCNLLCIYSRRYIDHDPETKTEKQEHNRKTMGMMSQLLQEGGKCIYVAPSGGRDRKNAAGIPEVAAFDPDSIEMFRLMVRKSGKRCHFIPYTLMTYDMMPPPETVEKELGEKRPTQMSRAHLYFGPEMDLEALGEGCSCKHEKRKKIADAVWNKVVEQYHYLESL